MGDINKVITRVLFRSDTTENWASKDPVLALGEIGVEYEDISIDSEGNEVGIYHLDPEGNPQFLHKVGNGRDTWSNLLYSSASPKHTVDTIIPPLSDVPASTKAVYDFQEIQETDEPLDSLVETGVFIVTDSILETDAEMYKVQVFKNDNFILQECRPIESSDIFTRFKKEGVWSEWVKDKIFDVGEMTFTGFTPEELAEWRPGWYFMNGDYYPNETPQAVQLNAFPDGFKERWGIINDGSATCVPNFFYEDGRAYFFRAGNEPGTKHTDSIPPITGSFTGGDGYGTFQEAHPPTGAFELINNRTDYSIAASQGKYATGDCQLNTSLLGKVFSGTEVTPMYIEGTPVIYLAV